MVSRARSRRDTRHADLIESLPDSIYRISGEYRFLEFYPRVGVQPPLPPEQFLGRTFDEVLPSDEAELHKSAIAEARRTGRIVKRRSTDTIGGKTRLRECSYVPFQNNETALLVRDVSGDGQDARNPDVVDALPDMVFRVSADFRYLDILPGGAGQKPYMPPEAFLGRTFDEVLPRQFAELHKSAIAEAFGTGTIVKRRFTFTIDSKAWWRECSYVPFENNETVVLVRDFTDEGTDDLRDRAHPTVLEAIPESIHRISGEHRFLEFFPGVGVQPPLPPEQFLGRTFDEVLPRDEAERHKSAIAEAFATRRIVKRGFTNVIDGKIRSRECRYVPLENNEIIALVRDFTDEVPDATNPDVVDAIPDIVFRMSADFRYLDFLPGVAGLNPSVPPEEFLGRTIDEVMPGSVAVQHKSGMMEALSTGKPVTLRYPVQVDGEPHLRECRIVPCEGNEILAFVRDCTDDVRPVIEAIPDMVFRISGDFRYLEYYPGGGGLQPWLSPEEFLGRTIDEATPKDLAEIGELYKSGITEALSTGRIVKRTYTLQVEGETRWREVRIVPHRDGDVLAFVRDLTDEGSNATHPHILEALPDSIHRISGDFRFLEFYPGVGIEPPLPPEEFLGRTFDEVLPGYLAELHKSAIAEALRTGTLVKRKFTVTIDGKTRLRASSYVPLQHNESIVLIRDLTDESQDARNPDVIDALPDMVFRVSADFHYLDFLPGGPGLKPYVPPEMFLGRTLDEVMPEDIAALCKSGIEEALSTGKIVTLTRYTLQVDGEPRRYECRMVPCEGNEVLAFVRDCTDDRADAGHTSVVAALPDPMIRVSEDFRLLEYHPGGGGVQPWLPPEEFLGRTLDEVFPRHHAELHKSGVVEALSTGRIAKRTYTVTIEGETRWRECRYVPCENNEIIAIVRDFADERLGAGDDGGRRRDFVAVVRDSYGLSQRERTVLQLLVQGVTDKDIAARLGVSVFTVNKHVGSVLEKMKAESRTEAAVRALREHLCE